MLYHHNHDIEEVIKFVVVSKLRGITNILEERNSEEGDENLKGWNLTNAKLCI